MKLYATDDVVASIRKAYEEFTHVLVNRGYTTIKPVYFKSGKIADLPVYQWACWNPATDSQLERWRAGGGVLLDCYTTSERAGPADALVFVECPLTLARIDQSTPHIGEYTVIPRPHTWRVHEECIDLRTPSAAALEPLWRAARGSRLTDYQLAQVVNLPKTDVQYLRASLKPVEEWVMKPRLAPESAALLPAWEWIGSGRSNLRKEVRLNGHQAAVKEMARLGHIALDKFHRYKDTEPHWAGIEERHAAAKADLAQIQFLLESLPDHLPGG